MRRYIQTYDSGRVHTIFETDGPFAEGEMPPNTVEVPQYTEWYHGALYDGETIAKLAMEGEGQIAVNQEINLTIKWVDLGGEIVPRNGTVTASCGSHTEDISINEGIGILPFVSAEPGEYLITVVSPEGCRAEKKVIAA